MGEALIADPEIDAASWDKTMTTEYAKPLLADAIDAYGTCDWTADALKAALEDVMVRVGEPVARQGLGVAQGEHAGGLLVGAEAAARLGGLRGAIGLEPRAERPRLGPRIRPTSSRFVSPTASPACGG